MPGYISKDERDKFRAAAADAMLLRACRRVEKPAPGAMDLRGFSLSELARESLRMAGLPVHGGTLEMVGRALADPLQTRSATSSDFPAILANVANKSLFEGYGTQEETWKVWAASGFAADFKPHTLARASETDDLDELSEGDEYKHGSMSDEKETFKLATYGKLFRVSRQAIINDDLGALTDIPQKHGEAAARKIGDVVYAVLIANSAMGDGTALFHSGHGNLGTGGAVSETTMGEGIKLMGLQKDLKGLSNLNIRAQYFIAPVTLEGSAEVFFNSAQFAGDNQAATRSNPYSGARFTRVYEPRLDADSEKAWYLAGPKGKTVKVFYLNGNEEPYLETREGWTIDGAEFKVRIDAAAKAVDWRALLKNEGPGI
jgi:hypothetical protein